MTKPKQYVSGDKSGFDLIPVALAINIFSRLPVKALAKCRCVSKLWSSIIRRPNYNQLFPIKSPATPRFLFIVDNRVLEPRFFFSSSPQPQNPDKNTSLVGTLHTKKSATDDDCKICPPVNGLVCRQHVGKEYTYAVISNPITGEYVTTPRVKTEGCDQFVIKHRVMTLKEKMYFGYDPIEKQFKVICMTWFPRGESYEYQVLTLGTENLSWRKIQCGTLHYPLQHPHQDDGICINGLLYYQGIIDQKRLIVCFDVRSEKFSFVNVDQYLATKTIWEPLILINYKNKLGVIHCAIHSDLFYLWVLENAEQHKWSNHFNRIPQVQHSSLSAGMIEGGEIVLYPIDVHNPFNILYYNLEKNIITSVRVSVPAFVNVQYSRVHTFPNFVEDVTLM